METRPNPRVGLSAGLVAKAVGATSGNGYPI